MPRNGASAKLKYTGLAGTAALCSICICFDPHLQHLRVLLLFIGDICFHFGYTVGCVVE